MVRYMHVFACRDDADVFDTLATRHGAYFEITQRASVERHGDYARHMSPDD